MVGVPRLGLVFVRFYAEYDTIKSTSNGLEGEIMARPSQALHQRLADVRQIVSRFPVRNPRIFGSVLRGQDQETSNIDILVDAIPEITTLCDMGLLEEQLSDLLGVPVDVKTPQDLPPTFRDDVVAEARPL